jgi:pSer/pThr/pTyr-binding forkhead associated (FHA) protein
VATETAPYARYQRLCLNSQIPNHERLRSNSDSCPDNVWGFPAYATREMWRTLRDGDFGTLARVAWQIFGEPALSQTYTPRSGDVFRAIDREAARIGWQQMLRFGRIRAIRQSAEGRLLVIASASDEQQRRHFAVAAPFVHLAIGYPAIQLLPDLAAYREANDDRRRVVNAYEDHRHIYDHLRANGGTVVLRGRGIVASRIIQRLFEERRHNPKISVVHLHRSRLTAGHTYGSSRRGVENEFEFQPFNWPKGCWTGEQRGTLERSTPDQRKQLLEAWGGTTTADRRDWRRIVRQGLNEGWYRPEYGVVRELKPGADGRVVTRISNTLAGGGTLELAADYVIDCTGLIASPDRSPVLEDLIETYGLERNPLGRLHVTDDFDVPGMRHGPARLFASGAITLGGPHAAVDSFLGLQYSAYRAVESARRLYPQGVRQLDGIYSVGQWWRWVRGRAP